MTTPLPTDPVPAEDPCPHCGHEVGDSWLVCAWCGEQLAVAAELASGARVGGGRYQILRVIGRGGFGITYDVGDRRLQRRVAMKELFPESAVRHGSMVLTPPQGRPGFKVARDRFLREARVLARFTHPGIVRVYEVFEEHGTAYLVMELLEGRTLVELLQQRGRPFPEAGVLDVAGRVSAALRPVHAAGVLHRDVNPSNVMLTHHGRVVVIDFGLARDYDQDQTRGMTRVVTPGYAPLEQYRGEGRFGPSTDVYGLAATCYRLATGRVPVSAVERDAGASLPSPHRLNPEISKAVSDAILDGLEIEPTHRPQDLDAFLARLGVGRLPDGPRSSLIDMAPPPVERTDADDRSAGRIADPAVTRGGRPSPSPSPRPKPPTPSPREPAPSPVASAAASVPPARDPDATVHAPLRPAPAASPAAPADVDATTPAPTRALADRRRDETVADGSAPVRAGGLDATAAASPGFRPTRPPGDVVVDEPRYRMVDGLPRPIGPHRRGRRAVLVPLAIVAIAVGSVTPVLGVGALVLVALPVLATMGDSAAHRLRGEHGVAGGWAERRMSSGTLAGPRYARNVVLSVGRATPAILLVAASMAGWYGLEGLGASPTVLDAVLRLVGSVGAGLVVAIARHGSARFRSGLGSEELVSRISPDGRISERVIVLWLVCGFVAAGALWLDPSVFPLP